jgi:predicted Zn-dependent peptidase
MTEDEFMQKLAQVTVADVQALAKNVSLQAVFFLDKETTHE